MEALRTVTNLPVSQQMHIKVRPCNAMLHFRHYSPQLACSETSESEYFIHSFVKLLLSKPIDVWSSFPWTDKTKVEIFDYNAQHYVWLKPNTAYQHNHVIPTKAWANFWSCNKTMSRNTAINRLQNNWKIKESRCCNGSVKVQTSTRLKCCGGTLREINAHRPQRTEAIL